MMTPKIAELEGRKHFVCPVVLGVADRTWAGSNGPLLYPADELAASVPLWNGRPLVVYHPDLATANGCANSPAVFDRQKIGHVFNVRFTDGKLKGNAYVDIAKCRQIDPALLNRIASGQMIEVSTGLFTTNVTQPNGVVIATNHRPDHLAILPDQRGACSIEMGAGLNRNAASVAPRIAEFVDESQEPLEVLSLNSFFGDRL
jgi:hypothetical protein